MLNQRPTNRRPRQRRNADPKEDKRNPHTIILRIGRGEVPDSGIIQALDGAGAEAVEACDYRDGSLGIGGDPGEEEEGGEEDAGDDGVDVAEAAVGEEGG